MLIYQRDNQSKLPPSFRGSLSTNSSLLLHLFISTHSELTNQHHMLSTHSELANQHHMLSTHSELTNQHDMLSTHSELTNQHHMLSTHSELTNQHDMLSKPLCLWVHFRASESSLVARLSEQFWRFQNVCNGEAEH